MTVGTNSSIRTVIPETFGSATSVVEKVANTKNTKSLSQSFLSLAGHFRKSPEYQLLYSLVLPSNGLKIDRLCIMSPKKGNGHTVHQILPKKGVRIATNRNSQMAHIIKTPRLRPETRVPNMEVRITI